MSGLGSARVDDTAFPLTVTHVDTIDGGTVEGNVVIDGDGIVVGVVDAVDAVDDAVDDAIADCVVFGGIPVVVFWCWALLASLAAKNCCCGVSKV